MLEFSLVQKVIIWAIPVLFAITLHEVAHGWVALRLGDRTAQMMGRLTLNPIKHVDPIGTLLVPGILLLMGGFIFGWAKPVPVSYQNLRKPKTDMAWVALAGPMANLVMATIWALVAKIGLSLVQSGVGLGEAMMFMGVAGVLINAMLMMLNLLPLPPLDGGRILVSMLPGPVGWQVSRLEPYGFFILLGLLYFGILGMILWPLISGLLSVLATIFSLPPQIFSIL
ncbi:membrane metalloprotease [Methylophaga thiooxydans]|uniref:Peptidase, M50 family, putative n=2 Tax=Methylophaga thiooxydans TaxID=392484 RepID=C0N5Q3_9GAMM|nr:site-2 protease family protein [Methylophaga thiooxydans]EEF80057.1 peptidase, M50 family, putative [Methylophaga thiooxydans DMS010]KGM08044.1 membrane metalloprotease [Methylophaga thiooxydans]